MANELTTLQPEIVSHRLPLEALKPIQRRAIGAILECPTIREAADAVGRHERTLHRWLANPVFRECLQAVCASRELSLEIQAQNAAADAFALLSQVAYRGADDRDKVQAARHVLEYADRRSARRQARLSGDR